MSLPITYIRSSSYGSHDMCQMKYFGEYVLGWKGKSNKAADIGTMVHKVMEVLAVLKLRKQQGLGGYTDDAIGEVSNLVIQDYGGFVEANYDGIDKIFDRVFEFYSAQNDHHFWGSAEYKKAYKLLIKALEFNGGQFHPFNQEIVSPEKHFDIEMKSDWAKYKYIIDGEEVEGKLAIKGTIDLIIKVDDETHEICDYKTGKRMNWATGEEYTYASLHNNFQLRLYHLAHSILYPDVPNVLITIYYIADGGPYTLSFSKADISDTLDMIRAKYEKVRDTEVVKPNYTWKCKKFCQFGKETFEDKDGVKALDARSDSKLSKVGEKMCMCDQMVYTLSHRGIDTTIANITKKDFSVGKYDAPGEVK
jgi:CRISPR/Cas system-associated exonuclease Cas4 (RecB family)